ncbi:UDP-3-O-(3-hydroxymyristoyl)glucosamine N-acyltransferase [Thiocystis violascens]|uniref:UDP-3-O-acylglucosamine N-acyltransferase n=1 Tax=Thiocystis violascens (strain ATCC 17096 / DSM 198 / 6111) TaxID=765911 RepID=I3YAZ4_THIV6|nr:UDP-3-O-(3-hydroxymyristoyl)glucosamine N-acyltransferase [Thiocystis violascens]AFL74162.1 UDP-3-O-(3-hydroxymyristoyl) glucosamine N-acyltransferase [Thiocystis violascens DSM 198]
MTSSTRLREALDALGAAAYANRIRGVNTLEQAGPHDLCFAEDAGQSVAVARSQAALIFVGENFPVVADKPLLRVADPRARFFEIAAFFLPAPEIEGRHPSATIHPAAELGADVAVGACAVIAAGAVVGSGSRIGPGVSLGPGVRIGDDCLIGANVSILRDCELGDRCIVHPGAVIGGDGFGFRWDGSGHRKVPQLGRVVVEDDVEIGCNSCIDRATLGVTRIGCGSKIDNLVQVAHNVSVGCHTILVSQSGIAGSSTVGDGVVVAGQVAISDHLRVGDGARIGGQSGVVKDVPPGAAVFGTPARGLKQSLRENAALARLPDLLKQVKRQQEMLERLEARLARFESELENDLEKGDDESAAS